jgi:hypothetical protein
MRGWILVHFVLTTAWLAVLIFRLESLSPTHRFLAMAFVIFSSVALSALIDGKRFAWPLEALRVVAFAALVAFAFPL